MKISLEQCKKLKGRGKHMCTGHLKTSQVQKIFLCAVIADAVLVSFNTGLQFSAHEKVSAAIINTAVLIVLCALFFCGTSANFSGKRWLFSSSAAFMVGAAGAFLDIERFYRFGTDIYLGGATIIALVLFVALYVLKSNYGALSRACGLFLLIFAAFGALLVITSASKASFTNLVPAYENKYGLIYSAIVLFKFPAALLMFASVPIQNENKVSLKSMIKGILCFFFIQVAAVLLSELVFGANAKLNEQPTYAIVQVAQFSVFEHLEPVFFSIFLLAILLKGIILFFAAYHALKRCFNVKNTVQLKIITVIAAFLIIVVVSFLSASVYTAVQIVTSAFAACLLCFTARNKECLKKATKKSAILVLCLCAFTFLSSCAQSVPLSERTIVKAIYFNEDKSGAVTASVIMYSCKPGTNTADVQGEPAVYTATGKTVAEALKEVENKQSKLPFYEQNKILLLGEGTFNNVSKYISYFMAQSKSAQDLNVFLTRISTTEFNELGQNSTDVIKGAEGIASASNLTGNKAVQLYEINLSENKEFSGYLPVLSLKESNSASVDELIIFDAETPLFVLSDLWMDITLLMSGKMKTLETDMYSNGVLTQMQTQKITLSLEAQSGGNMKVSISGTVKSVAENGNILDKESENNAIEKINDKIEDTTKSILELTTFVGNDIFNLNTIMYNEQNMFCKTMDVNSNLKAGS